MTRRLVAFGVAALLTSALMVGQTQDGFNERTAAEIRQLRAAVERIEAIRAEQRLPVLENMVEEMRLIGRAVILLMVGQMILSIWQNRKRS